MRKQGDPEVFRITGARAGLTEDVAGRQRRYIISMSVRTLSVILTVVLWNVERPLAWATLVVGTLLPYVAVVLANAGRENVPSLPSSFSLPPVVRPPLDPTGVQSAAESASEPWTGLRAEPRDEPYEQPFGRPAGEPSEEPFDAPSAERETDPLNLKKSSDQS